MTGKKKVPVVVREEIPTETPIQRGEMSFLSVDYGREDLNNMGMKINEIIEHLNGRH
jgi:hypothetical protein